MARIILIVCVVLVVLLLAREPFDASVPANSTPVGKKPKKKKTKKKKAGAASSIAPADPVGTTAPTQDLTPLTVAPAPVESSSIVKSADTTDAFLEPPSQMGGTVAKRKALYADLVKANMIPTNPLPYKKLPPGPLMKCNATFYGPDVLNGIHGGTDNLFEHVGAGQYTADQLRKIGKHFCAFDEKTLAKGGMMGKVIRITGPKRTMEFVVVDTLPSRDGNVCVDIHGALDWLALGGDGDKGVQPITYQVVGEAALPVSPYSPYK